MMNHGEIFQLYNEVILRRTELHSSVDRVINARIVARIRAMMASELD